MSMLRRSRYYDCVIQEVTANGFKVVFPAYGNVEEVPLEYLQKKVVVSQAKVRSRFRDCYFFLVDLPSRELRVTSLLFLSCIVAVMGYVAASSIIVMLCSCPTQILCQLLYIIL